MPKGLTGTITINTQSKRDASVSVQLPLWSSNVPRHAAVLEVIDRKSKKTYGALRRSTSTVLR